MWGRVWVGVALVGLEGPPGAGFVQFFSAGGELGAVAGGSFRDSAGGFEEPLFLLVGAAPEASCTFVVGEVEGSRLRLVDLGVGRDAVHVPAYEPGGVVEAVAFCAGFVGHPAIEIPGGIDDLGVAVG